MKERKNKKQQNKKPKKNKSISEDRDKYSKPNYLGEIFSNGSTPALSHLEDTQDNSEGGRRKKFNKWIREQENSLPYINPCIIEMT